MCPELQRLIKFPRGLPPVTVTVTEALVLRPLLEDRGRITESIRILVPV